MSNLPGSISSFLNNHCNDMNFIDECVKFFGRHLNLLDDILLKVKKGKHLQNIIKSTLEEVVSLSDDKDRAFYLILASGMLFN